jgi:hypothetical protein
VLENPRLSFIKFDAVTKMSRVSTPEQQSGDATLKHAWKSDTI